MKLSHFKSDEEAIEFITSDLLWILREDLAAMQGPDGDSYTAEEYDTLLCKINDIESIAPLLTTTGAT